MPDANTTNYLIGVIQGLPRAPMALLRRYFQNLVIEDSEEIHFDKSIRYRLLAPFVSPLVEGHIVEERGFHTETFKPAYLKPKTPLDASGALKRIAGEQIGGSMAAADRQRLRIATVLEDHITYIDRRLEWMAAQVLLNAAVTVSGDKYPTQVVNYGRDAALTVTLTGADLWSAGTSTPVEDLHAWNELAMQQAAGGPVLDFIMEPSAFTKFRAHADVVERLDTRRAGGSEITVEPLREEGLRFMGTIDNFNIWVYQAWYEETIGTLVPFFPAGAVVGANPAMLAGVQHFGAILDAKVLRAMSFYPKTWYEEDPGREYVMTQSAPLIVPGRPNATIRANVL